MENIEVRDSREDLLRLQAQTGVMLRRRLVMWAVRWAIGFAIIGVVTYFYRDLPWLWWIGIGLASVTPLLTLTSKIILDKKLRQAQAALSELEATVAAVGDDADG